MKCNTCKNPVEETDVICQWCGAELTIYSSQDENHPIKMLQSDLMAIEQNVREKMQLKLDAQNNNLSTFDKIFGTKPSQDWDDDLEDQAIQKITRVQAKFLNTYILPSNPKVLEELLEIALQNYKQYKPNFWDDEEESHTQLLSKAWLNLSNRCKKKIGVKNTDTVTQKITRYFAYSPNLRWTIILIFLLALMFGLIATLKHFIG
ncbi:MAG: hypothetical protein ACON4B_02810 [Flavobacteriaceae bacterium]